MDATEEEIQLGLLLVRLLQLHDADFMIKNTETQLSILLDQAVKAISNNLDEAEGEAPSIVQDYILIGRTASFTSDGDRITAPFTLTPTGGAGIIEILGLLYWGLSYYKANSLSLGGVFSAEPDDDSDDD